MNSVHTYNAGEKNMFYEQHKFKLFELKPKYSRKNHFIPPYSTAQ